MATIYDIANLAGVSSATVSLIMNGRGDDLRIAKKTQENVRAIAKEIGYVPNVSARKLLSKEKASIPEIGLLWFRSQHPVFLNTLINKLNEMQSSGLINDMNVIIYPFENKHLSKMKKILSGNNVHGFIIPSGEPETIDFLEKLDIKVPVITIYSNSGKYHSVDVNNQRNGQMAGEIFFNKGLKNAAVIKNLHNSYFSDIREAAFLKQCEEQNISVTEIYADLDLGEAVTGSANEYYLYGRAVAKKVVDTWKQAGSSKMGVFVQNDASARGLIAQLRQNGIKVPEDVMVVSYGYNSEENKESNELTMITYPVNELAEKTWLLMKRLIHEDDMGIEQIYCESDIFYGNSCPR